MLKRLFLLLTIALFFHMGFAQTPTTQGKEFWVSFMRNGYRQANPSSDDKLVLIATAKRGCTVTVSNPNQNWQESFVVGEHDVSMFTVPDSRGYNSQMDGVSDKGLYVTASDTISLYIANEANNSYDAANVLPVEALGCQYMVQSNKSIGEQSGHYGENRASLLVIATEDNTQVQITPSCLTNDNHPAGQPYTINLNRGECYHVINKNVGQEYNQDGDFTGTLVSSAENKPIALFNGNCITSVPGGLSSGYDHVFEQAMPIDHWGKRFVVTSISPAYYTLLEDMVKITALNDNTTVMKDGVVLCRLNAGESHTFMMPLTSMPCAFLESDNPIAVYLYNHSHQQASSSAYGDPSMVWIAPVEQTIYEVTFSTFQAAKVEKHFVNVVCYTEHAGELTLDDNAVTGSFSPVTAAPEFSYARIQVPSGAHILHCPGGFVAYVYGMGENEGYAYTVGSSAKILTKQLYVDDVLSTEFPDGYPICQHGTVSFRVETNYEMHHVEWDFGDQQQETGITVSHDFDSSGDFEVQSVIYRDMNGDIQPFDTLSVTIHVNPVKEYYYPTITTCGDTYEFEGVDYDVPGDHDVLLQTSWGCDSIVHLHLQQGTETVYYMDPVVHCGPYEWFGTTYTETDHHLEHRVLNATPEGCDSLYILDLTIGYPPVNPEKTVELCEPITWHGQLCDTTNTYSHSFTTAEGCVYDSLLHFTLLPSETSYDTVETCGSYEWHGTLYDELGTHDYSKEITGENGCKGTANLYLILHPAPPFEAIRGVSQVSVATNFWPGEYEYFLDDSTGLSPEDVIWELTDNENGEWGLRPHGASCTVVTITKGSKTLQARVSNGICDKEVSMDIRCSGYDVDEEELALELYPNPATEEVLVSGDGVKEVVLYDLTGRKVNAVTASSDGVTRLSVTGLAPALYLVEIRTGKGNKTKLLSVTK